MYQDGWLGRTELTLSCCPLGEGSGTLHKSPLDFTDATREKLKLIIARLMNFRRLYTYIYEKHRRKTYFTSTTASCQGPTEVLRCEIWGIQLFWYSLRWAALARYCSCHWVHTCSPQRQCTASFLSVFEDPQQRRYGCQVWKLSRCILELCSCLKSRQSTQSPPAPETGRAGFLCWKSFPSSLFLFVLLFFK